MATTIPTEQELLGTPGFRRAGDRNHAWARYGGEAQRQGWVLAQAAQDADRYNSERDADQIYAFANVQSVPDGYVIVKNWADPNDRRGV